MLGISPSDFYTLGTVYIDPASRKEDLVMALSSCILAALLLVGMVNSPIAGLTVYRLGGEEAEPPLEVTEGGADFVQFSWADLDAKLQGAGESLTIEARGISPLFFTPDQNGSSPRMVRSVCTTKAPFSYKCRSNMSMGSLNW